MTTAALVYQCFDAAIFYLIAIAGYSVAIHRGEKIGEKPKDPGEAV